MLTASVNVVQCSFVESQQGEISGLSRSVSNLGSSLGVRDRRNRPRRRHRNHPGTVLRAGHGRARGVRRDRVYRGDDAAQDHHTRDEPQPLSPGDIPADAVTGIRLDHPTEGRSALRARTNSHWHTFNAAPSYGQADVNDSFVVVHGNVLHRMTCRTTVSSESASRSRKSLAAGRACMSTPTRLDCHPEHRDQCSVRFYS